ncbi:MAG TPA: hypothetical protein VH704_01515 [Casimicrobiaceae bacterium]|nr:hypothetical protein [Casimicrobiaceae bacterium]
MLLSALMRETDAQDLRRVFEDAVVRETAYMLERGALNESIRAFEDAAGAWSLRSRRQAHSDSSAEPGPAAERLRRQQGH